MPPCRYPRSPPARSSVLHSTYCCYVHHKCEDGTAWRKGGASIDLRARTLYDYAIAQPRSSASCALASSPCHRAMTCALEPRTSNGLVDDACDLCDKYKSHGCSASGVKQELPEALSINGFGNNIYLVQGDKNASSPVSKQAPRSRIVLTWLSISCYGGSHGRNRNTMI